MGATSESTEPQLPQEGQGGLAFETEIITRDGIRRIGDLVGTQQTLLTRTGGWAPARVVAGDRERLCEVRLSRQGEVKVVYASSSQRWPARTPGAINHNRGHQLYSTEELGAGFRLQYIFGQSLANSGAAPIGIVHGLVFGDGTRGATNARIVLCGAKRELLAWFTNHPHSELNQQIHVSRLPWAFKALPPLTENRAYLYGWLAGLMATDGSCGANGVASIVTSKRAVADFIRSVCAVLGIGTYAVHESNRVSNLTGRPHLMYSIVLMRDTLSDEFFLRARHRDNFIRAGGREVTRRYWVVKSVHLSDRTDTTFSATDLHGAAFALADNVLVGG